MQALEEAVDGNLVILESMCLELESIRSNATICLETLFPYLQEKFEEMEKVYAKIEFLESVVNRVQKTVDEMEVQVERAEKVLGASPSVLKMFTSIFKPFQSTATSPSIEGEQQFFPPDIFKSSDLFADVQQHPEGEEAHEIHEATKYE